MLTQLSIDHLLKRCKSKTKSTGSLSSISWHDVSQCTHCRSSRRCGRRDAGKFLGSLWETGSTKWWTALGWLKQSPFAAIHHAAKQAKMSHSWDIRRSRGETAIAIAEEATSKINRHAALYQLNPRYQVICTIGGNGSKKSVDWWIYFQEHTERSCREPKNN